MFTSTSNLDFNSEEGEDSNYDPFVDLCYM